jgi:hypothetical protein
VGEGLETWLLGWETEFGEKLTFMPEKGGG